MRIERRNVVMGSISREAIIDAENYWAGQGWKPIPPWVDETGLLKLEREVPDAWPVLHSGRRPSEVWEYQTSPGDGRWGAFVAILGIVAGFAALAGLVVR